MKNRPSDSKKGSDKKTISEQKGSYPPKLHVPPPSPSIKKHAKPVKPPPPKR